MTDAEIYRKAAELLDGGNIFSFRDTRLSDDFFNYFDVNFYAKEQLVLALMLMAAIVESEDV